MFRAFFGHKRWWIWAWLGSALILLGTWYKVQLSVQINDWFGAFYDSVQKALSQPGSITEARYLRVIELKTAQLFRAAATLGAIAADLPPEQQAIYGKFGHDFGMTYQLIDDLLDYTADPEVSGKNLGTDLAEGKPTLPLLYAMQKGSEAQRALIRDAIANGRVDRIDAVLETVEATGAIPYSRALAGEYSVSATAALQGLPETPHKQALIDLVSFCLRRDS